jgi:hypothetical protein
VLVDVATLLVVSLRVRLPRSVFAVVSICAVVAVGAAGIRVGSLPPPGRQWLRYWLSTRQAPLGAAANLIAEAPRTCGSLVPDPYPEEIDSFAIGEVMRGSPVVIAPVAQSQPCWSPRVFGRRAGARCLEGQASPPAMAEGLRVRFGVGRGLLDSITS